MSSTATTTETAQQQQPRLNLKGDGATRATADQAAATAATQKSGPSADKTFDFSGASADTEDPMALRQARKESLVVAFRVFAKLGLGVGVVGHLTVRDPVREGCFWGESATSSLEACMAMDKDRAKRILLAGRKVPG